MSGLAGQAIGLEVQSPTPIGGPAAVDAESKGSMENFIGFGLGATSYDPSPVDFDAADDTVTSAADGSTRVAPEYTDNQLMWGSASGVLIPAPAGFPEVPFNAQFYKSSSGYFTDFVATCPLVEGDVGVVTKYVDIATGSDTNPGTSEAPYKTLSKVARDFQGNVVEKMLVKVKPGTYGYHECFCESAPNNPVFACVPWGVGDVVMSAELPDRTWTFESGSVWYCSTSGFGYSDYGSSAWDANNPNQWGEYGYMSKVVDLQTCSSTPNSYFIDQPAARLYVHTFDSRQPDTSIHVFNAWSTPCQYLSHPAIDVDCSCYFEGITILGGTNNFSVNQSNASRVTTVQVKNAKSMYSAGSAAVKILGNIVSAFESYLCSGSYEDCISYHKYGSFGAPSGLEIGCESRLSGLPMVGTANQGSTMHDGGTIVRLNGFYHHNENDQVADVGAGTSVWNIGCIAEDGRKANYSGFLAGNAPGASTLSWLEGCSVTNMTYGLHTEADSISHVRDFHSLLPNTGAGTVEEY